MPKLRIVVAALALVAALAAFVTTRPGSADEENDFWFRNYTGATIVELYVEMGHLDSWGPDRLGEYVLQNGEEIFVRLGRPPRHCHYNVKAVWSNGAEWVMPRRVNLCETVRFTLRCNGRRCWEELE